MQLTNCGHRICQSCLEYHNTDIIECCVCLTSTSRIEIKNDQTFERELAELTVECNFCLWYGCLKYYQIHLDQTHRNANCDYCNEQFDLVENLDAHKVLKCEKMLIKCLLERFGCDEKFPRCKLSTHYSSEGHFSSLSRFHGQYQTHQDNVKLLLKRIQTDPFSQSQVVPGNQNITQLQSLFEILEIPLTDLDFSSDDTQRRFNNALLNCQAVHPTLTLEFLNFKLSTQENIN